MGPGRKEKRIGVRVGDEGVERRINQATGRSPHMWVPSNGGDIVSARTPDKKKTPQLGEKLKIKTLE